MSFYPCLKGSDTSCVNLLGEGACCLYAKVETANMSPTDEQQIYIDTVSELGFPTATGESGHFCMPPNFVMSIKGEKEYEDPESGIIYTGYCDAATQLVRGVAAAALALLAVSY